jgi:hypothetical protein
MNDPVFVEAARAFAQRILNEGGSDDSARLRFAWRVTLARPPAAPEMQILERTLQQLQTTYRQNPAAAGRLISVGDLSRPAGMDDSELAAWTAFSNVLLNLNETISN